MTDKPTLVVMAAGMGSRYGGLKQVDPVGPQGEVIMEYSIYDARQAGFGDVVVVLNPETAADFRTLVGDRVSKWVPLTYAYQEVGNLPQGYEGPQGRVKPWGTAQAVLAAKQVITGPFVVINADDYYGPQGFKLLAEFLSVQGLGDPSVGRMTRREHWAMVGYRVENTVTQHGSVSRGVCEVDEAGHLIRIDERTRIVKSNDGAAYSEDEGRTWVSLPHGTTVSMNLWGFTRGFLDSIEEGFPLFLDGHLGIDPLTCEYQLPSVVQSMIDSGRADVQVLTSWDRWYGVTYQEDKPGVAQMIAAKHADGEYPPGLWGS